MTSEEVAAWVSGSHFGPSVAIQGLNSLEQAGAGELAYAEKTELGGAECVLCKAPVPGRTCIVVVDPKRAFIEVLNRAFGETHFEGIHPSAIVAGEVAENVAIGAHAVVGAGSRLAKGVVIYPGVVIGRDCSIGANSVLFPRVVLYDKVIVGSDCRIHAGAVLGADGFSTHPTDFGPLKVPHIGNVILGDGVEIGANTCVDRAFLNSTVIGEGTHIDNLVQIGHNSQIGVQNLVCGQAGIAGSVRTGARVTLGGQVGVSDHLEIGDDIQVGGGSLVLQSLKEKGAYMGIPAVEAGIGRRALVLWPRLPEIWKRLNALSEASESK
jgi:UDP-3-O-[3-hydroxymyristoyl] glucosamine N-acyltransferase